MQSKNTSRSRRANLKRFTGLGCAFTCLVAQNVLAMEVELEGVVKAREQSRKGEMVLIDIRRPEEWRESGIPDTAVALDMTAKDFIPRLKALINDNPGKRLGLICAVGSRSRYLADWLHRQGVENVVNVSDGVHGRNGWLANKLPVRQPG